MQLDAFDVRILSTLQRRGDISHVELAEVVCLSASQCARRLDRLRRQGYIERVVALLSAERLGFGVMAHTLISLRTHDEAHNAAFHRFVREAPEVVECFAQTGDADLIMKVVARDLGHLSRFFDTLIAATGGLAALRSGIVLKSIKRTTELPLGGPAP
ncbi:DNA-binding transcriptional activator DecR [Methylobacterium crusticola]|uniref:DNA-binding transcriptional activator DecR n=1 Tax=Methylobacterium crusticola TaxID=1697972 RepID=A0ABQ4R7S9_9HYPH|nr:Lrp/AsnC family transcriptional regulator [Methylobacterium crusticola]GJD53214.1 DNA-binding transcriptional activator DecR [Methylobacterium crusticola]